MSTQKEYHDRELRAFANQVTAAERLPRADKAENRAALIECWIQNPAIFAERINWVLNGSYGYGTMVKAIQIADNKRLNRTAGLSQLTALAEWNVTADNSRKAYLTLTTEQRATLDALVQGEIKHFDANRADFEPGEA
jgi:hypothetical protein